MYSCEMVTQFTECGLEDRSRSRGLEEGPSYPSDNEEK